MKLNSNFYSALLGAGLAAFSLQAIAQDAPTSIPVELVNEDRSKTAVDWPLIGADDISKPWKELTDFLINIPNTELW